MSQKESEWEERIRGIFDEEEADWLVDVVKTAISTRDKEIAEKVEKLPPYYVEDSGEKMISSSEVLKILNHK